jgi:cyanoexosortase A
VNRIQQYWRELSIVCLSAFPVEHLLARLGAFIDVYPPLLDAKISAYLLWYLGFDATQQGVYVSLPTGAIEIYGPCSSFGMMFYLWQFSAVFLLTFPLSRNRGIVLVVLSTLMALIVNGVRLSLLAVIVSHQDQAGFAYWHGSSGAQIFSTVAVLLFGCLCSVLMKDTQSREDNLGETL